MSGDLQVDVLSSRAGDRGVCCVILESGVAQPKGELVSVGVWRKIETLFHGTVLGQLEHGSGPVWVLSESNRGRALWASFWVKVPWRLLCTSPSLGREPIYLQVPSYICPRKLESKLLRCALLLTSRTRLLPWGPCIFGSLKGCRLASSPIYISSQRLVCWLFLAVNMSTSGGN